MERNVRFNFDEIMVRIPPALEGEVDDIKSNEPQEKVVETPETPVEPIQTIQERSRHIQKESEYVKMLKEGSGVTGESVRGHPPNPISITKSDNHVSAPAPTSIPTPYIPPHRQVHFKIPL